MTGVESQNTAPPGVPGGQASAYAQYYQAQAAYQTQAAAYQTQAGDEYNTYASYPPAPAGPPPTQAAAEYNTYASYPPAPGGY